MQEIERRGAGIPIASCLALGIVLLLIIKVFLAAVLDLYSDEVFYWQASSNPAIAYSDLPFMTALLIGLGSNLDPQNTLAARSIFIVMGGAIPLIVYWIAKPISNHRYALESATLSLCLPLGGFLGLLAVPDVPLILFGLLSIGCFERAIRCDDMTYWLLTGMVVALGLCTHYRFVLYPLAAVVFLALHSDERRQWKNPRFWLSIAIASIGLIPIAWFNLSNQLSSASFYFVDRHPWEFQASGLLHIFKQAGLVTPPLYALLIYTIYHMYLRSREGDRSASLLLSFSLVNILVYLLLAPWTDATSTSIHWPLSGYFPLLIFAPAAMRGASASLQKYLSPTSAHRLILTIPLIGFLGTLSALVGVGSQAFQHQLQAIVGKGILSNKMAGWKEFDSHVSTLLQNEFQQTPLLLTDNYYTLAQLEFAGLTEKGYTIDEEKAVRDGRIAQYRIWQQDRLAFERVSTAEYLFVAEDSTLDTEAKHQLLGNICARTERVEHLGELILFNGDKKFSFYKGLALQSQDATSLLQNAAPCPYPANAWIDSPARGAELSGMTTVNGWAYNEDIGVDSIRLIVDGREFAQLDYGGSREDVVEVMQIMSDPNRPHIGFDYSFDTSSLENGTHLLEVEVVNLLGISQRFGEREIEIDN